MQIQILPIQKYRILGENILDEKIIFFFSLIKCVSKFLNRVSPIENYLFVKKYLLNDFIDEK